MTRPVKVFSGLLKKERMQLCINYPPMFYISWELSSIITACSEYEMRRLNFYIDLNLDSKLEYTATTTKFVKVDLPKQTGEFLKKKS